MVGWEDAKRLFAMGLPYTGTYKYLVIRKWMSIASQNAEKNEYETASRMRLEFASCCFATELNSRAD